MKGAIPPLPQMPSWRAHGLRLFQRRVCIVHFTHVSCTAQPAGRLTDRHCTELLFKERCVAYVKRHSATVSLGLAV